jgi:hypothetical protein
MNLQLGSQDYMDEDLPISIRNIKLNKQKNREKRKLEAVGF